MAVIKKRKPWNRVSEQVYSLVSFDADGKINMNIATYVVPVTMDIKRYCVAIYKHTQTHKNIFEYKKNKDFVLQGLSIRQINLVRVLGKKSGQTYDKQKFLSNYLCSNGSYLAFNAFTLQMKIEKYIELGDHDVIIAKVQKVLENDAQSTPLTTTYLQKEGIIL